MRRGRLTVGLCIALVAGGLALVPAVPAAATTGDIATFVGVDGEIDAPGEITNGPGGDLWFTSPGNDRIGRIDPVTGDITTYASEQSHIDGPGDIAAGPTGPVWFTNVTGNFIGRLDPDSGVINVFTDADVAAPRNITSDGAGGAWFTSGNRIGHITSGGTIESFLVGEFPYMAVGRIERGADGVVWFLARRNLPGQPVLGELDPTTREMRFYGFPIYGLYPSLVDLAPLRNGDVEVQGLRPSEGPGEPAEYTLWRVRRNGGEATVTADAYGPQRALRLGAGPDLSVWTTDASTDELHRISSPTSVQTFTDPATNVDSPVGLVTGPDGNVWFTSAGNDRIGRIDASASSISITKGRDESSVVAGQTIHYHLTVTNTGTTPLTGIGTADANAPGCVQAVPDLAPGEEHTLDCSVTTPTGYRGAFTNTATVDTAETGPVSSNQVSTNVVAHPAVSIVKSADDAGVIAGESISMHLTISNTGDVPLVDVVVDDVDGPECAGPLADIPVGASVVVDCSHPTTDADRGTYVNSATVDTAETEAVASNTVLVQVGSRRGLAIGLSADESDVAPRDTVHYHAQITNTGDVPLTGIDVQHSASADCADDLGVLGAGDTETVDCDLVVGNDDLGTLSATVTVSADHLAPVTSDPIDVTVAFPAAGFDDVAPTAPAAQAVDWAAFHDIMGATASGDFQPRKAITRAQLATALFMLMDHPAGSPSLRPPDVPASAPYRAALSWTVEQRLQGLRPDGSFDPRAGVTRAELVRGLWRMVGSPTGYPGHGYTDVPPGTPYAAALRWARGATLLDDLAPGNRFGPTHVLTRSHVVRLLYRLASLEGAWTAAPARPSTVLF